MEYFEHVTLKDGSPCVLRNPTGEDARAVLELLKRTSRETDHLLRYPEEIRLSVEEERRFLNELSNNPKALMISAIVEEQLVANASITTIADCTKCRHRASFAIAVLQDFWGKGLGTLMTTALLKVASQTGYQQIELEVSANNRRALALYQKFGFDIYGTNPRAFMNRDGAYVASHLMLLEI